MQLQKIICCYTVYLCIAASAIGQAQTAAQNGKITFVRKCAPCHGKTGTKGMFGAKNLKISTLNDAELIVTISNGRKIMPSWKATLTPQQIAEVIAYIKILRN